jgi:hypothetical protein
MKAEIRTLLRDIQAAARIGHTESLWAALDNLLDLPQVAGNHPMSETFLNQVIVPIGEAVGHARVNHAALKPLVTHPYAAFRAIAGIALLGQYLDGRNGTTLQSINALVQDPRKDVREGIRLAAIRANQADPDRMEELYQAWQGSDSPRVQALAYQILPNLPEAFALKHLEALETGALNSKPEVKRTLASTLSSLAANGQPGKVLEILAGWAAQPDPDHRMVARCLSSSWAAKVPAESLQILTDLAARTGPRKRIRKALENLHRHGAQDQVQAALESWRSSENANLQAAGRDEKLAF